MGIRRKTAVLLGAVASLVLLPVGGARALDAVTAEIDDVRLGMSGEEVLAALRHRFGDVRPARVARGGDKLDPNQEIIQTIDLTIQDKYSLSIRFAPRVPVDAKRPEAAYDIGLALRGGTEADRKDLQSSIIAKYGQESGPGWCSYDASGPCFRYLFSKDDVDSGLELVDPSYLAKVDALYKTLNQQKPPL